MHYKMEIFKILAQEQNICDQARYHIDYMTSDKASWAEDNNSLTYPKGIPEYS